MSSVLPNPVARDNIVSITGGPVLWSLHFLVVYCVNAIACEKGWAGQTLWGWPVIPVVVVLVTVVALAALAALGVIAWRRFVPVRDSRHLVHERDVDRSTPARQRFLALSAFLLVILSAVSTLMVAVPALWVPPCGL